MAEICGRSGVFIVTVGNKHSKSKSQISKVGKSNLLRITEIKVKMTNSGVICESSSNVKSTIPCVLTLKKTEETRWSFEKEKNRNSKRKIDIFPRLASITWNIYEKNWFNGHPNACATTVAAFDTVEITCTFISAINSVVFDRSCISHHIRWGICINIYQTGVDFPKWSHYILKYFVNHSFPQKAFDWHFPFGNIKR